MSRLFVPDNTVLINFTLIDRQDLLVWFVRATPTWTLSVARECAKSSNGHGLAKMTAWGQTFGSALMPDPREITDARAIAESMKKPGENSRTAHMGEAEAISILVSRKLEAVFLTDDFDAARVAQARQPLIHVASTTKILALAAAAAKIDTDSAKTLIAELLNKDRVLGNPPSTRDFDSYVEKLRKR